MNTYKITATCAAGLESVLVRELKDLGYMELVTENGSVSFKGTEADVARCNINLRCAGRVFIELASFTALDFEELFQGAQKIPWEEILPEDAFMHVTGRAVKSVLHSAPGCQSTVKKAIIKSMQRRYHIERFPENGPEFKIEISMLKDTATLSLDTSGAGLHKRGYREEQGEAPLRETLAAGMIKLSGWTPDRILADPFCGSGTIAIEAALMGLNIAPGIFRSFDAEKWPFMADVWKTAREEAADLERRDTKLTVLASDSNKRVFVKARANAERAGVAEKIEFQRRPMEEFSSRKKYGCIITNPPYGERMGGETDLISLYQNFGNVFERLGETWSCFVITAFEGFEKAFGRKADRNRKLYNGPLKSYYYQYYGERPPGPGSESGRRKFADLSAVTETAEGHKS